MNATGGLVRRPTRQHPMAWSSVREDSELVDILTGASPRPKLVVPCGPSHTGKSTFADKVAGVFTVVSSEGIRQRLGVDFDRSRVEPAVWSAFRNEKSAALRAERNLVLDACHLSTEARWHSVRGAGSRYGKLLVLFDVPLEVVLARCSATRRLPLEEAKRMWRVFEQNKPTRPELETLGFDWVYVLQHRAETVRQSPAAGSQPGPCPGLISTGPIPCRSVPELARSAFRPAAAGQRCDKADGSLRPWCRGR